MTDMIDRSAPEGENRSRAWLAEDGTTGEPTLLAGQLLKRG